MEHAIKDYKDPTLITGYRLFSDASDDQQTILKGLLPDHIGSQSARRLVGYYGAALKQFKWHQKLAESIPDSPYFWSELRWSAQYESICHLDDLLLRRLRLGLILPDGGCHLAEDIQAIVSPVLDWDEQRWRYEWQRYADIWRRYYFLPEGARRETTSPQRKESSTIIN